MDSLLFRKQVFTLSLLVVVALLSAISVHGQDSNPVIHVSENDEIGVEHVSGWHGCSGGCGRSAYSRLVYDDDKANIRPDLDKSKGCQIGCESDKGLNLKDHSDRHSKNNVDDDEDDDEYQATHGDSGGNYAQYEQRVKYKKPSGSHEYCRGKTCRSGRITESEQGSEKAQSHGKRFKYSMSGEPHIQGGEPHIQARFLATVVPVSISVEGWFYAKIASMQAQIRLLVQSHCLVPVCEEMLSCFMMRNQFTVCYVWRDAAFFMSQKQFTVKTPSDSQVLR